MLLASVALSLGLEHSRCSVNLGSMNSFNPFIVYLSNRCSQSPYMCQALCWARGFGISATSLALFGAKERVQCPLSHYRKK